MPEDITRTTEEKLISKKAMFNKFCNVHVSFKNGTWENGYIEDVGAEFLVLKIMKSIAKKRWGTDKKVFFFIEISDIQEYREKNDARI